MNNNVNQDYELNNFESMKISLASPEKILEWSHGEVKKPETIIFIPLVVPSVKTISEGSLALIKFLIFFLVSSYRLSTVALSL